MCLITAARDQEATEKIIPTREVSYVTRTRSGEFQRSREYVPAGPPIPIQRTSYVSSIPPSVIEGRRRSISRVREVYPAMASTSSIVYAPSARSSKRRVPTTKLVEQPALVQQVTSSPAPALLVYEDGGNERRERRRRRREYQYEYRY